MVTYSIISSLTNAVTSLVFGAFVIHQNPRNIKNRTYLFFSLSVAVWSIFYFFWQISDSPEQALFYSRGLIAGAILIPVFYLHHIAAMFGRIRDCKKSLVAAYVFAILSLFFSFTSLFVAGVAPRLSYRFWPVPGLLFHPFLLFWVVIVVYGMTLIVRSLRGASGIIRNQMKYILVATVIGWGGGFTNYFLWYNIPFPPAGNILVSLYVVIAAYAIIKFRLMDVNVAITRSMIFILVYAVIIGVPVASVVWGGDWLTGHWGDRWWYFPLGLYALFSFFGPFLYLMLQRRAEGVLLREQKAYQQTLLQASRGMTLIKDLEHLLKLTVHILTKTVKITHVRIFLWDNEAKHYVCRARRGNGLDDVERPLGEESPLIVYLRETEGPVLPEEARTNAALGAAAAREMESLGAALVVPSFVRDRLLGFVALGSKRSNRLYTEGDLDILATLANQAALAIENCFFLAEFESQQVHLFQAAKMADLGTMASGIGHQMNNRFNVIKLGAESAMMVELPKIRKHLEANDPAAALKLTESLLNTCRKISKNAAHGGEIVKRLLDFSRLSKELKAMDVKEAMENSVRLWECKHDLREIDFVMSPAPDLKRIKGNFSEIEEVLFNLLDNAADAIAMKEEAFRLGTLAKPEGWEKGSIRFEAENAELNGKPHVRILVRDNGIGMDAETQGKLFVPFFTLKATAVKGTGLGLYIIRKMIDAHQGHIQLESVPGEGTVFSVFLPALAGG
ncbi:MAG TPA: ATP-binding protein [Candidatus Omnitrophota bacterium]|nr:ATP-binding protein [Candidatus Omnitrophota bacterium]